MERISAKDHGGLKSFRRFGTTLQYGGHDCSHFEVPFGGQYILYTNSSAFSFWLTDADYFHLLVWRVTCCLATGCSICGVQAKHFGADSGDIIHRCALFIASSSFMLDWCVWALNTYKRTTEESLKIDTFNTSISSVTDNVELWSVVKPCGIEVWRVNANSSWRKPSVRMNVNQCSFTHVFLRQNDVKTEAKRSECREATVFISQA